MNIVEHTEVGNPIDVLKLKQIESAPLAPGEARVKVLAAPIHPANLLQIAGQYLAAPALPATPGMEGLGRVVEVGGDVVHLQVGQNVLLGGLGGTWRDEIVALADAFIPAPQGDVEQLSMLAVNPMTAYLMMTEYVDLDSGDWIIQSAANSAVGEMVIQLAAKRGLKTVNVVRREELVRPLLDLGADVVLVDGPDLAERVAEATGGGTIKLALDAVAGETYDRLVETLTFGGTIVSYGALSGEFPPMNMGALIAKDVRARGFWLNNWYEKSTPEVKAAAFASLAPLVASGQIKIKVDSRYPLEEIADAVTRAATSGRDGKVLLVPNHA